MLHLRRLFFLPFLLVLAACGGDSSTGPKEPEFPALQGTYDFSAPINEAQGARFSGNMTLLQADRDMPGFEGTFVVSLIAPDGENVGTFTGNVANGTITENGAVTFNFEDPSWRFTGTLSNNTITGTYLLRAEDQNFTGTFTAVRR